jgi:hypothetical protein
VRCSLTGLKFAILAAQNQRFTPETIEVSSGVLQGSTGLKMRRPNLQNGLRIEQADILLGELVRLSLGQLHYPDKAAPGKPGQSVCSCGSADRIAVKERDEVLEALEQQLCSSDRDEPIRPMTNRPAWWTFMASKTPSTIATGISA